MRRILQISTCTALNNDGNESSHTMALCDDGTLWMLSFIDSKGWQWLRLPGVPQGAVKAEALR
jgi:hypothetical protein